jgi:hypothetical protein
MLVAGGEEGPPIVQDRLHKAWKAAEGAPAKPRLRVSYSLHRDSGQPDDLLRWASLPS